MCVCVCVCVNECMYVIPRLAHAPPTDSCNRMNLDNDCGMKGLTQSSQDVEYEFDVGMGLCIIGFVLSVIQMTTYCFLNNIVSA